ncbi:MAG: hypothetical protein IAI49_10120 [Candidatus Eremiobacteraeota bacterium]|nr:hypothetical protein [Candidatus Eremiobacteraeota bacterium]
MQQASATPQTGRRLAAFHIKADDIVFYSNRFVVGADGDVDIKLGDGTRLRGNTFFMDLRLNRFVIAGNVRLFLNDGSGELDGAAFAEYFDFDRAYFVPITSEPDRWTFAAGNYKHPLLGRQMPGDTFHLPELSREAQFLRSRDATIDPRESVRFAPARLNFGLAWIPFPAYFLDFSQNPNYAENALSGAFVDAPYDFAGGRNSLATAHLRYDTVDNVFPAIELHQFSENSYAVASINPLTRPLKQYNFLASDKLSPALQVQLFAQDTAFQHGFSQPLSSTAYATFQVTAGLRHSYVQFQDYSYWDSLLARPALGYYGDPSHPFVPDHPSNQTLTWTGFRTPIHDLPLTFQLRSGYGVATNGDTPLTSVRGAPVYQYWYKTFGANLATKQIVVSGDPTGRHRDLYFVGTFDKQRQYFSTPHHLDTTTVSVSLTKNVVPQKLTALVSYTNQNIGDFYGPLQAAEYPYNGANGATYTPTFINPITGQSVTGEPYPPGYSAFDGFATSRSFREQVVFTPSTSFAFTGTLRENRDFPTAIAGPRQIVGDQVLFENYGVPPYEADLDLRFRVSRILTLDIGRSYFFNFGGFQRWSPQFFVQVSQ